MSATYAEFLQEKGSGARDAGFAAEIGCAGIGSEGVGALRNGRRFAGVELKPSYFATACRNLSVAEGQMSLLETATA